MIRLDFNDSFGGLMKTGTKSLMKGDTTIDWYYPVGIISKDYNPYFPGPRIFLNITNVQLFVKKDC